MTCHEHHGGRKTSPAALMALAHTVARDPGAANTLADAMLSGGVCPAEVVVDVLRFTDAIAWHYARRLFGGHYDPATVGKHAVCADTGLLAMAWAQEHRDADSAEMVRVWHDRLHTDHAACFLGISATLLHAALVGHTDDAPDLDPPPDTVPPDWTDPTS